MCKELQTCKETETGPETHKHNNYDQDENKDKIIHIDSELKREVNQNNYSVLTQTWSK